MGRIGFLAVVVAFLIGAGVCLGFFVSWWAGLICWIPAGFIVVAAFAALSNRTNFPQTGVMVGHEPLKKKRRWYF